MAYFEPGKQLLLTLSQKSLKGTHGSFYHCQATLAHFGPEEFEGHPCMAYFEPGKQLLLTLSQQSLKGTHGSF